MVGTLACCSVREKKKKKNLSKILSIALNGMMNDLPFCNRMFCGVGAQKGSRRSPTYIGAKLE